MAHKSRQKTLGLVFALLATLFWSAQPIALKLIVRTIPPSAVAFYKIFSAAIVFLLISFFRGDLLSRRVRRGIVFLLFLASVALAFSYVFFNSAFLYISPGNSQLYFQFSRVALALGGVFLLKERFHKVQWMGLITLTAGLVLYFGDQWHEPEGHADYNLGVILVIGSGLAWAAYALIQKKLLKDLSSLQILLSVYFLSSLMLARYADLGPLNGLSGLNWFYLAFICVSNLLAFGCFSEALRHWEASRVGALLCLTPFVTIALMFILGGCFPGVLAPEMIGGAGYLGAALVVIGSMVTSLFHST